MITRVLFILPSTGFGGIVSSYLPLYSYLSKQITVKTLLLQKGKENEMMFADSIISDSLLGIYNDSFASLSPKQKIGALFLKPYKRYCLKRGNALADNVAKLIVKRLMRIYHFDIVVGFSEGAPTKLASYFTDAIRISWIHCDYKYYYESVCLRQEEFNIYSRINHIVCVSEFTRQSFISIFPLLSNRVLSIHNLIDETRIKALSIEPIDDDRFIRNGFTIVSVGRIVPVKRFSLIPQIASKLKEKGCSFRWYILGPNNDVDEFNLVLNRISQFDVGDSVYLLGSKSNPYSYMRNSDVLVCLSYSEACPMVFNEAKILEIPVVTAGFGSASEFIRNGKDGLIVRVEDIQDVLEELINNKSMLRVLKQEIHDYSYSNDLIYKEMNSLFR